MKNWALLKCRGKGIPTSLLVVTQITHYHNRIIHVDTHTGALLDGLDVNSSMGKLT